MRGLPEQRVTLGLLEDHGGGFLAVHRQVEHRPRARQGHAQLACVGVEVGTASDMGSAAALKLLSKLYDGKIDLASLRE